LTSLVQSTLQQEREIKNRSKKIVNDVLHSGNRPFFFLCSSVTRFALNLERRSRQLGHNARIQILSMEPEKVSHYQFIWKIGYHRHRSRN